MIPPDEQMIEQLWAALASFQSGDGTWLQIGKADFAAAVHSVMAGKVAELEQQRLMILAAVYREAPRFVATICDEKLDRSGKLLGEVRALADVALAPYPEGTK